MESNEWPKVSIVTPSYNQGQFLEETILSVLNQNYPNLEYIIIDGGSTDNSVEIIKKYADRLEYWVSEPDRGQSDAINKGFHRASGEILHWLNSDDVLVPGALQNVAEYFLKHPEIGCVIGDIEMIDENSNLLFQRKAIPFHFRTALYGACSVPQPSTLFRREAWLKTGDLDVSLQYQMDFEYFLRMAKAGVKFGLLRKPVARFRLHASSKTISEYDNLVWSTNRSIQSSFLPFRVKEDGLLGFYMKFMKWIYRTRAFIVRAITRGDAIPFRGAIVRRSI
ncbi:MAG: glycosyltransferase [Tepidanaerobacteraceae bacterium]|jgi:glycosyltransferase involved in cell wall biosynthesis|nr:glycosyltransferase [Tepidanaerobacteraceae bacterium]